MENLKSAAASWARSFLAAALATYLAVGLDWKGERASLPLHQIRMEPRLTPLVLFTRRRVLLLQGLLVQEP